MLRLPPGADALVTSEAIDDLRLGVFTGVNVLYPTVWLLVAERELLLADPMWVIYRRWLIYKVVEAACDG